MDRLFVIFLALIILVVLHVLVAADQGCTRWKSGTEVLKLVANVLEGHHRSQERSAWDGPPFERTVP